MPLEELDISIVKLLRQDPRMTYTQIAETLGISRVTAKTHIEEMLEQGLISLTADENIHHKGGKMAMLGLELLSEDHWKECLEKIENLPWVLMGFKSMGKSNLKVILYGETDELLEERINDFRYYHCVNFISAEILGKTIVGQL